MTEEGWLSSDDPVRMFRFLTENIAMKMRKNKLPPTLEGRKPGDRKWRLFCCTCCLLVGVKKAQVDKYEDHGFRIMSDLEWAKEWVVPGIVTVTQERKADLIREIIGNPFRQDHVHVPYYKAKEWFTPQVLSLAQAAYEDRPGRWEKIPFTGESTQRHIEDGSLDPLRLSVLADALEEAGCDCEDLLRHLRGWEYCPSSAWQGADSWRGNGGWRLLSSSHVRGCWALGTILEK